MNSAVRRRNTSCKRFKSSIKISRLFHHMYPSAVSFTSVEVRPRWMYLAAFRTYVFAHCCYEGNDIMVRFPFRFHECAQRRKFPLFPDCFRRFFRNNAQLSFASDARVSTNNIVSNSLRSAPNMAHFFVYNGIMMSPLHDKS